VDSFDDRLWRLVADLRETLEGTRGIGLAAPQVGELLQVFVLEPSATGLPTSGPLVFVNPEVVALAGEALLDDEGCLSFPGVFVPIRRAPRVRVRFWDEHGDVKSLEAEGLVARALQHEADHLRGCLYLDAAGPVTRKIILQKLHKRGRLP
jgi:peptide deformylase